MGSADEAGGRDMEKLRIGMLLDLMHNLEMGVSSLEIDRYKQYPVVAVLNPGAGPDEQLLEITKMTWDHNYGVLRLEITE